MEQFMYDNSLQRNAMVTLYLDEVRRCPAQRIDPEHFTPEGPCMCTSKRGRILGVAPSRRQSPPRARVSISGTNIFRPGP